MANLLTPAEQAMLQAALNDVTDTLHSSTVTIVVPGVSLDIRQTSANTPSTSYNVPALINIGMGGEDNTQDTTGKRDVMEISIKINIKDLVAVGLADSSNNIFVRAANSYLIYEGVDYEIISLGLEKFIIRMEARRQPKQRVWAWKNLVLGSR